MKRAILAFALSISAISGALAADSTPEWSGLYVGAQGGFGPTHISQDGATEWLEGSVLGIHLGYNVNQNGPWLFGIEGDVSYGWNTKEFEDIEFGTNWQWSVRTRLGYVMDHTMIYGAAGIAGASAHLSIPALPLRLENSMVGWTIGTGIEQAFNDHLSGRAEYRHTDYGNFNMSGLGSDIGVVEQSFRLGLSYKF